MNSELHGKVAQVKCFPVVSGLRLLHLHRNLKTGVE